MLTQEQLAERAGLNVRTIRRLESDDATRPQSTSLRLLATALGLNTAEQLALVNAARGTPARISSDDSGSTPPTSSEVVSQTESNVPRQLPAAPPMFTGRVAELADLEGIHDMTAVVISAIDGMAGIGKTALAVHAAHRMAGAYPDGQLFLDLHGYTAGMRPVEPSDALDRLLRADGVPSEQIPEHLEDRAALYRSRLSDRKILILLDNAAAEEQVAPLLPGTPGCLVLITSRHHLTGLDHTHTLSLDVLPLRDATTLFINTAGERRQGDVSPEMAVEIVELCGRLPLAIRIAGARLRSRPRWTAAHLAERLRDQRQRLAELAAGQRSVTAALDVSYLQLSPELQRAYRLTALHPGADFDRYAAAALIDATPTQAERLIDDLLVAHLLQESAPGRYRFHDLVRAHAASAGREDTEPAQRAVLTRLLDHFSHTVSVAMNIAYPYERERRPNVTPTDTPVPVFLDRTEATGWLDTELSNLLAAARHAAEHGWPDQTLHLSATLHRHLRTRGRYTDAETLHYQALTTARRSGRRTGEVHALNGLGDTRRLLSRYEQAVDSYQLALTIARAIGHRSGELDALAGLGDIHHSQSRFEQAAGYFGKAREIARSTADRSGEMETLFGLGWVHLAQGEPATDDFERALAIARDSGDNTSELHALRALGHIHRLQGRHELADDNFERALNIARANGSRIGEIGALIGLGWVHRLQGRYVRSADAYQQALILARETGGLNWQFEALHGRGRLHHVTGHEDRAISCHQEALKLATDLGQLADQARAHDGLAHAYRALRQVEQARRHWQRALDILTSLGIDVTEDDATTSTTISAHLSSLDQQRDRP